MAEIVKKNAKVAVMGLGYVGFRSPSNSQKPGSA